MPILYSQGDWKMDLMEEGGLWPVWSLKLLGLPLIWKCSNLVGGASGKTCCHRIMWSLRIECRRRDVHFSRLCVLTFFFFFSAHIKLLLQVSAWPLIFFFPREGIWYSCGWLSLLVDQDWHACNAFLSVWFWKTPTLYFSWFAFKYSQCLFSVSDEVLYFM